jgi:DegV family protein with EDD domain
MSTLGWNIHFPRVRPPTAEELSSRILRLGRSFDHIILILVTAKLISAAAELQQSLGHVSSRAALHFVDSKTASVGLGFLVQVAAEAAHEGLSVEDILLKVRASIPHIYTVFCVQNLGYLYYSGQVDAAQASIGEMLGLWPLLLLENGSLVPIQKARNTRQLVEILYEFVAEFNSLRHLALLQGTPPFTHEARNLYDRIVQEFPTLPYSEHNLSSPLAATLGPRSLGLVVLEKADHDGHRSCHR